MTKIDTLLLAKMSLSVYNTIFFPLILVVNNVRKTVVKFLDRENILKPLFLFKMRATFMLKLSQRSRGQNVT